MKSRSQDEVACWFCDYGPWLLLIILLIAAAILTRELWLPLLGVWNAPVVTPTASTTPMATLSPSITATVQSTLTPVDEQSGYVNSSGGYALNFPAQWQGTELGSDIQFVTPQGAMAYVHVEPNALDLNSLITSTQLYPVDVLNQVDTTIAGQPGRCIQIAMPGSSVVTSLSCFVLDNQAGYVLSLTELDHLAQEDSSKVNAQFMDLLASFRFRTR